MTITKYSSTFYGISMMVNNFCDFLFAVRGEDAFSKGGLLLKKRICSLRSKFFPLRVDPIEKGGKMKLAKMLPLKVLPLSLRDMLSANAKCVRADSLVSSGHLATLTGPRSAVGSASDSRARGPGFDTRSSHILSFLLRLIQEGQLSVTGESMCTKYWLTASEV